MFEAFKWMFKNEKFREHVFYLIKIPFIYILIAVLLAVGAFYIKDLFLIAAILMIIAAVILLMLLPLFYQGYFWELTMCITERKIDFSAPEIYKKGSIKEIASVELPELSAKRFIWRGIASIVATLLLIYPLAILFGISVFSMKTGFNMNIEAMFAAYGFAFAFIGFFIPALLWNYAVRDSVVAVWNVPKAIHIIGCYTVKYIWNILLMMFVCIANNFILMFISKISEAVIMDSGVASLTALIIYGITYFAMYIYMIFVNSYLIGTIAPPGET